jgi:hypothetical protein
LAAWFKNVMRPRESPAKSSSVTNPTPMAIRSRVLRRLTATAMPMAATSKATMGMSQRSLTTRLKNPENFDTWSFDTMVIPRPLLVLLIGLIGLNSLTPRAFSFCWICSSAGVTLTTIAPPCSTLWVSFDCLPVMMSTTAW